jgi:hypothetical protein
LSHSSADTTYISTYVSFGVGFTGGSYTERPVSINEYCFRSDAAWIYGDFVSSHYSLNVWYSSDGKIFRFGGVQPSGAPTSYYSWVFETLSQPVSLAVPVIFGMMFKFIKDTIILDPPSSDFQVYSWSPAAGYFRVMYSTESIKGGNLSVNAACQNPDIGGKWPVFPFGVIAMSPINPGYMGRVEDMYLVPTALATQDYMPSDGSKQFVVIDDVLLANDGTFIQWF